MSSIFGLLDKRQRAASAAAAALDTAFTFEDRADLLNDILEDDTTTFPLVACPPEVLAAVLLLSDAACAVRLRPVCTAMRSSIDADGGLWCLLSLRDFADLGGLTKHYKGLRTLIDWDDSRAVRRLEWDPLMICAPPPLRYILLSTGEARRRLWNDHGHSLGAGWAWFSAKVCRRMATSTFLRWAGLQYDESNLHAMVAPFARRAGAKEEEPSTSQRSSGSMQFRCGRQDAVTLSAEAVTDIYETVQRWHSKEHCEMMRAHIKGPESPSRSSPGSTPHHPAPAGFSVTPTLDAVEAVQIAVQEAEQAVCANHGAPPGEGSGDVSRGAASRHIEEAQLRLALELSKAEARDPETEGSVDSKTLPASGVAEAQSSPAEVADKSTAASALPQPAPAPPREEPVSLPLQAGSSGGGPGPTPAAVIFLKSHCVAERVDSLPDALEKSIEHVVGKMATSSTWALFYESITEELAFRAKSAAHALCAHARAVDGLLNGEISLEQERMCLPIWKSSAKLMTDLSKLRRCDAELRQERYELIRQASLEWCEMEDLTEFLDSQLAPLELAIDNFRAAHEASSKAHTPHVRDIGRLMFRNFCLLNSHIFRPLCLAAYALVHEVHAKKQERLDVLESFHAMLVACDVADDHLSASKHTKEAFVEHLVVPITAAIERLSDWDLRGHPSRDRSGRKHRC